MAFLAAEVRMVWAVSDATALLLGFVLLDG